MQNHSAVWWRQVFEIIDRALELRSGERAAYIDRACGESASQASLVKDLLTGGNVASFLDGAAAEFAEPLLRDLPADSLAAEAQFTIAGSSIGPYRIVREIGQGGMGTVYLAERADDQYERRVALKLLRGLNATDPRLVRRFVEERQILAALHHPDIARLFDGGVTADGLPWFAMEYVEGVRLDHYCDEHRLPIESRLELFCRVCAAVQYAHRNLIVHRDLKPGNILVTAEGAVKLLDFGIAKLLGTEGASSTGSLTMTGERVMTPLYASPEQIRAEPISTASDVYSLGVLLYELLTGRHPYGVTTREPYEVARAVLEHEPERPSVAVRRPHDSSERAEQTPATHWIGRVQDVAPAKMARRLQGDLDTIVIKAIEKDPTRRYSTVEQLETDVRRHLAGQPVTARPDSRLYRARKFVRRHRVGVVVTGGVASLVLMFGVVAVVQSARIRNQAARVTIERDRAEQVSQFLAGLFQTSDPYAGAGDHMTARAILDSGAARVERELVGQPVTRAQMLFEMGRAYHGLGVRDRARRFLEVSLAIRRRASPEQRLEIAQTLDVLGVVLLEQGELEAAERVYNESLSIRRELSGPGHRDVAQTLNGLAAVLRSEGRFREADSVSQEAVGIAEALSGDSDLLLAESLEGRAHAVQERGDDITAERLSAQVLALRRETLGEEHPLVARSVVQLARAVSAMGQESRADSLFRYGLALARGLLGEDHPEVAEDETEHARLLHRLGFDRDAEAQYRHALQIARRRHSGVHPLTATILLGLGELELARGAPERAEPLLREGLAMRRAALAPEHPHIAEAEQLLGAAILARRRFMEAERYLLPSHERLRAAHGEADPRTRAALRRLISLYEVSGQPLQAARYRERFEESPP